MHDDELLRDIMKLQFYAVDLNLYLDNFPNNKEAVEDYKKVSYKLDELIKLYEKNNGALSNFGSAFYENPQCWTSSPWPWECKCK